MKKIVLTIIALVCFINVNAQRDEYENYCNSWPAYADIIQPIGAIPYIAADGTKQYCAEFIELTGSETSLAAGTYLVASDINFDHTVTLTGDVTLILADNCNMTIGSSDSRINNDGIDGYVDGTETWYDITIYGQTAGTGAVNVYVTGAENWAIGGKKLTINGGNITADANGDDACAIAANANLTINGGQVTATASGDAFALASNSDITINGGNVTATGTGSAYGITAKGNITISSGTVTATGGNDGYGICADYNVNINGGNVTISGYGGICANNGDITLGWTNATDRIYASSYYLNSGSGTVTIADGHKLYNGKGFLSGTVSTFAVNGKTLQPALSTAYITAQGTAADDPADAIVLSPDQTTLGAHNYVALGTLNYTTGLTLTGNATLILADNCQMNVGASSNRIEGCGIAKSGKLSLTITSQSIGSDMGALSIYTTGPNNYAIYAKDVTINGGNITADTNTDYCPAVTADDNITINGGTVNANTTGNEANAFYSDETFNYNGGIVNATAAHGYAIYVEDGNYNFSWRNAADRITIGTTGLGTEDGFTATFTRLFTDADGNYYGGTLTGTDALATLAGKTISGTAELVLANAADNSARIAAANGMSGLDVKLDGRTLYKDGDWNTLCLPFSMTAEQIAASDLAGATLMELDTEGTYDNDKKTGLDGTTLNLYFKSATSISAGKPYIIKWDGTYIGDPIVNPVFLGVTINNSASTEVSFTGGSFKGTYKPIVWSEENKSILFLGDNNTLYWPKPEGDNMPHLNAFRAYFELIDVNGVREIKLNYGDEEITAVANSQLSTLHSTLSEWYDMQGRKVSKPTKKGMYIHKGSKVVIK